VVPYEDIGVQQNEEFVFDEKYGLALNYTSNDNERTSLIYLVCDANRNDHEFKYLPQVRKDEYVFQFIGPCSCPDGCTDDGINDVNECDTNNGDCGENTDCVNTIGSYQCVCKPGFVQNGDNCTVDLPEQSPICYPSITPYSSTESSCICDMVDGSGSINLSSLSNPSETGPRWTDDKDDFNYFYNPCNAFTSNQTFFEDLAVLQQNKYSIYYEYDLGVQSYAVFTNNSQGQIQLHYHSANAVRQTTVRLVCDETASNHTFTFDGEPLQTQYEFTLMGPCACPGGCNETKTTPLPTTTTTEEATTAQKAITDESTTIQQTTAEQTTDGLTESSSGNGNGTSKLTFGMPTFLVMLILVLNMLFVNQ